MSPLGLKVALYTCSLWSLKNLIQLYLVDFNDEL